MIHQRNELEKLPAREIILTIMGDARKVLRFIYKRKDEFDLHKEVVLYFSSIACSCIQAIYLSRAKDIALSKDELNKIKDFVNQLEIKT